ncbi:MAG: ADP-ribosylglycohydrolase family protein [Spirochaetia bacterium]|nr:ADP-ribosylglycohydrolase family protein [Spirochaetia bacterium]
MIGAIAGDVLGSPYEGHPTKDKGFKLFRARGRPTDDSVLSLAVAEAILDADAEGRAPRFDDYRDMLLRYGRRHPDAGYGGGFRAWLRSAAPEPYGSSGNGSAMRASAVGWAFDAEDEVLEQAALSAAPTHDHRDGVKGARAVALAVFLARKGRGKEAIRSALSTRFGYDLDRRVADIRPSYRFEVGCPRSVPEAVIAFLDSDGFEDALRNAVSLGGDADTQACIAGAIAEAHFGGVPPRVAARVLPRLEEGLFSTLERFAARFLPETQRELVAREREGRRFDAARPALDPKAPGRDGGSREGGHGRERSPSRPRPSYRVIVAGETMARLEESARRLAADPSSAGARLRGVLGSWRFQPLDRLDGGKLLDALFRTRQPRVFAESEVAGDGSDWTPEELGLLGDTGVAVPVTVFDDGRHSAPRVHERPFGATLLFSAGALLRSDRGRAADADLVRGGRVDPERHADLYERRLLPLLRFAAADARSRGRDALVTVPGLGCGQFAGAFRGTLGPLLRDALARLLERHASSLSGLRALRFDPYDECADERREFDAVSFLVRPLARSANPLPQLRHPRDYEEPGDDFSRCDLYSVVAWDHASWPGNDFWGGARATDDGVKAAATDAMYAISGFRGRYDAPSAAYLPPEGFRTWGDLARDAGLSFGAAGSPVVAR